MSYPDDILFAPIRTTSSVVRTSQEPALNEAPLGASEVLAGQAELNQRISQIFQQQQPPLTQNLGWGLAQQGSLGSLPSLQTLQNTSALNVQTNWYGIGNLSSLGNSSLSQYSNQMTSLSFQDAMQQLRRSGSFQDGVQCIKLMLPDLGFE